jgi:hypothetical protein
MEAILYVGFYLLFCGIAGAIASKKGRPAVAFFLLSILVTPLIGIILALVARPNVRVIEQERIASGQDRRCPFCAEVVKREAKVCRFCGKDLPEPESSPGAPSFKTREEYEAWKAKSRSPKII